MEKSPVLVHFFTLEWEFPNIHQFIYLLEKDTSQSLYYLQKQLPKKESTIELTMSMKKILILIDRFSCNIISITQDHWSLSGLYKEKMNTLRDLIFSLLPSPSLSHRQINKEPSSMCTNNDLVPDPSTELPWRILNL